MKYYEVKSRLNRPITIQMDGPVPGVPGLTVHRTVATRDPKSEESRKTEKVIECPPVFVIPPRGRITLPEPVIKHPSMRAKINARQVRVKPTRTNG